MFLVHCLVDLQGHFNRSVDNKHPGSHQKVLLMAGARTYFKLTAVLQLHEACILVWKEYNHNHLIFALL